MGKKKADRLKEKNEKRLKKNIKESYKMGIEYYKKVEDKTE